MVYRLLTSALLAGLCAGLVAAALQLFFVQPVLLQAEMYESGQLEHFGAVQAAADHAHDHAAHDHGVAADGSRDLLTVVFTVLVYTGFALVMVAAMSLAETSGAKIGARSGLIWGIAGFVAVQLAPAFSLPPEVPGMAAGDLEARQIWWFATVGAAILAMALAAFGRGWVAWCGAVAFLLAPHLIGAPHPDTFAGPVPPEIAALFAVRALGVGLAAWVLLGALCGFFWQREAARQGATA